MRTTQRDINNLRTVSGRVGTGGEVIAGTGFTVNHTGTGFYTIRLQPRTGAILSIVVTAEYPAPYFANIQKTENDGSFQVAMMNSTNGSAADSQFGFTVAVLERRL
jgi:hypothetical protein